MTLFGIAHCDSVKRARTWLAQHGVAHDFHDFRKAGLDSAQLDRWLAALPWEQLLNRKGSTWRSLDDAARAGVVDAAGAKALMLSHTSLVKRPVVQWPDGSTSVGFDSAGWGERLVPRH